MLRDTLTLSFYPTLGDYPTIFSHYPVSASAVETTELVAGEPEIYGNVSARNTSYSDISSFFSTLESYFSGGLNV